MYTTTPIHLIYSQGCTAVSQFRSPVISWELLNSRRLCLQFPLQSLHEDHCSAGPKNISIVTELFPGEQVLPSQGISLEGHVLVPVLRVSCFSQERYDGRLGLTGLQVLSSILNLLVPQDLSQYLVLLHGPNMNGARQCHNYSIIIL